MYFYRERKGCRARKRSTFRRKNKTDDKTKIYIKKEGYIMKIVVIRSPKMLSGLFRVIFKIKEDEQ